MTKDTHNNFTVRVPVVVIVYNRPSHTAQLIERLSKFQFTNLVFIADGPKNPSDKENCIKVRNLIQKDWACSVNYIFSEVNLGCKNRVVSGLDFVFEKYESAIILEDDCIPADSFFRFCELMLDRYRDDDRILMVCGTLLVKPPDNLYSYFFSQMPHIWGWASWRGRWKKYSKIVPLYQNFYNYNQIVKAYPEPFAWALCENLRLIDSGSLDTWDAQTTYLAVTQSLLSIFPSRNLIQNIGFDYHATHTKEISTLGNIKLSWFDEEVQHPEMVIPFKSNDFERLLIEGYSGLKLVRLVKILKRKNGLQQVLAKLKRKIGL